MGACGATFNDLDIEIASVRNNVVYDVVTKCSKVLGNKSLRAGSSPQALRLRPVWGCVNRTLMGIEYLLEENRAR